MYLIKTYLDKSDLEGIGVFAGEDIPKGTVMWKPVEGFDQVIDPEFARTLPDAAQKYLKRHGFVWQGKIFLCSDYGQFTNHSDNANSRHVKSDCSDIAARDIKKGEEITGNYREFDEASSEKPDLGHL